MRACSDTIPFFLRSVAFMLWVSGYICQPIFAQSAQEAMRSLQGRADATKERFREALTSAIEAPAKLDALAPLAEQCRSELEALNVEIDSQLDFLSKKESGLSSSGLSESDRKELLAAIAAQKKPLATLKSNSAVWKKILTDFNSSTLPEWKSVYSSFAEIAGEETARRKLEERLEAFLRKLPSGGGTDTRTLTDSKPDAGSASKPVQKSETGGMSDSELRALAKTGNPAAEYELGMRYKFGSTQISQDSDQAFYWLTRAAEKGNVEAQLTLGVMYRNGEGVGMNYQIAKKWLSKAAASGSQYAKSLLREM
jgi:hypothetical protein